MKWSRMTWLCHENSSEGTNKVECTLEALKFNGSHNYIIKLGNVAGWLYLWVYQSGSETT
jgi:hypothetical protein